MSNDVSADPLIIDTAGSTTLRGACVIQAIFWVSNSVAGKDIAADDDFSVTDAADRVIVSKRAEGATDWGNFVWPQGKRVSSIKVPTMGGGICYIYLGREIR